METSRTPSEMAGYDRPLDTLFSRLPSVFVPTRHVATLGQLSDIARAYGKGDDKDDGIGNKTYLLTHENDASSQQQLQWRFFYLDTDRIDQELEKMTHHQQQSSMERQDRSFLRTLESELTKVHDFYHLKLGEIQRRLDFCNKSNNDPSYLKKEPHKRLSHLESEMSALPWDVQHLAHFVKANYCNLFAIVHKYDRHLSSPARLPHDQQQQTVLQNQMFRLVASKPFCEPAQVFSLVVALNEIYKAMRSNQLRLVNSCHNDMSAFSAVVDRNDPHDSDDDDAETHYYSTPASLHSWDPHVGGDDDELRQVPNYTSIYITNTGTVDSTTRTTTTTVPPRLTTTLLPTATLPPSPATTSDSEDYDDDETASLSSANKNNSDMLTVKQFWVHPDNLTEVMLYIAKYTDLSDSHLPPAQVDTASRRSQQSNQSTITTLHLDTPNLESYNNRVNYSNTQQRECKTLRMRWYEEDQRDPSVSKPVVAMEEKVYRPSHSTTASSIRHKSFDKTPCHLQEEKNSFDEHDYQQQGQQRRRHDSKAYTRHRLWLKAKNMEPWLNGEWSFKHLLNKPYCRHRRTSLVHGSSDCTDSSMEEKIMQMENDARSRRIEPVLKTTLRRTVFSDHESELVISIDTDIAIARHARVQKAVDRNEDSYRCYNSSSSECDDYFDHQPPPPKSRISSNETYPYPSFSSDDMVRFPYAVVKISYPSVSRQRHAWLLDLCSSSLLEPVHDFSVYAHGIGGLMSDTVQTTPHWLSKMNQDLSRSENRGQLLKQLLRVNLAMEHNASSGSNLLKLPPTPFSSTSAIYSPASTNSSSSCISSNNRTPSTRATTPSSTKGKSVSEEDLRSAAVEAVTSNERQPLLQKQHPRPSVGSYCSFDHPSSSRSDPAQCRDCMTRRQSSPPFYNKSTSNSNSRSPSSGSLFSQYNDKETTTTSRIAHLVRTMWPTLGDLGNFKSVRPGAILPIHTAQHISQTNDTAAKDDNYNKYFVIEDQKQSRALKLTIICLMSAVALALIFYYALSTL
ncbi:VTC domain-containing protein [Zychaea mexicana]|uniref:VTC domain-containing protein n=1 Tax=Zychaea mexicana TaxID=64656 RepID=UPI0022FDBEAA|nr:VTC domain-containing protein [Zychaea mexicana]KAI9493654.1 VTC domain-containing protein [Zychaea mexicana]